MGNTNTELFNLQLIVTGKEEADDLKAKISLTEQKIASLWSTMKGNPAQFQAAIKADIAVLNELQTKLKETEDKISGLGGSKGKSGGGRALLEVSRGVEDLQYGLNGVLNNIPGIVSALGGPAGLVGVISLVSVGAYQLYKQWDTLAALWGGGHTKTQAEEMEELRKKTSLTADEAERLARADNLTNKTKELRAGKTDAQEAEEKATTHAITEAGLKNVVQMVKQYAPEMLDNTPQVSDLDGKITDKQKEIDRLKKIAPNDTTGSTYSIIGKLEKEVNDLKLSRGTVRDAAAEAIVSTGALPKDWPGNRAKLLDVTKKAAEAEPEKYIGLQLGLEDADPEAVKEKKRIAAHDKRMKETKQEQEKEAKEEEARLNKEAQEGEKAWEDAKKEARKSKSFLQKPESQQTPAEKAVQAEYTKFEDEVGESMRGRTWLGFEDSELTPEQKEAKKRHGQREKAKDDRIRDIKKDAPELDKVASTSIEGMVKFGGMSLEDARKSVAEKLSSRFGTDVANALADEGAGDAKKNMVSDFLNGKDIPKSENATILSGASSLRDNIQGSVKSPEYDILMKQLAEYQRATGYLETLTKRPSGLG